MIYFLFLAHRFGWYDS